MCDVPITAYSVYAERLRTKILCNKCVNSDRNKTDIVKFENGVSMQMCTRHKQAGRRLLFYSHAKFVHYSFERLVYVCTSFCSLGISPHIYFTHIRSCGLTVVASQLFVITSASEIPQNSLHSMCVHHKIPSPK